MNHANEEEKHSKRDIGQALSKHPIKEVNESLKVNLNNEKKHKLKSETADKKVI